MRTFKFKKGQKILVATSERFSNEKEGYRTVENMLSGKGNRRLFSNVTEYRTASMDLTGTIHFNSGEKLPYIVLNATKT